MMICIHGLRIRIERSGRRSKMGVGDKRYPVSDY